MSLSLVASYRDGAEPWNKISGIPGLPVLLGDGKEYPTETSFLGFFFPNLKILGRVFGVKRTKGDRLGTISIHFTPVLHESTAGKAFRSQ